MRELFRDIAGKIGIIQNEEELVWAVEQTGKYLNRKARSFVEFGSAGGGSFAFIAKTLVDEDAVLLAVDPQLHGMAFNSDAVNAVLCDFNYTVYNCSSLEIGTTIAEMFGTRGIDILHIDSVHLAAHTEQEWAIVKPYMNSPSVVILHDIKPGFRHSDFPGYLGEEIKQLSTGDWFQKIKFDYSYEEKKVNGLDPDMGIGLLLL